jgi:hypothetical protein
MIKLLINIPFTLPSLLPVIDGREEDRDHSIRDDDALPV